MRSTIKAPRKYPQNIKQHLLQRRPEGVGRSELPAKPSLIAGSKLLLIERKGAKVEHDFMALLCLEEGGCLFYNQMKIFTRTSDPATEITLQILFQISKIINSVMFLSFLFFKICHHLIGECSSENKNVEAQLLR